MAENDLVTYLPTHAPRSVAASDIVFPSFVLVTFSALNCVVPLKSPFHSYYPVLILNHLISSAHHRHPVSGLQEPATFTIILSSLVDECGKFSLSIRSGAVFALPESFPGYVPHTYTHWEEPVVQGLLRRL